jgi:DNA-binding NarL/FixJ family response regulator
MSKSQQSEPAARVLIVDDHPAVREALSVRIRQSGSMVVCGEAADTADALKLVDETKPHLAVVDIALKTGNGIDLIKRMKIRDEQIGILVWSMYAEDLYAERALRAGASGYITKQEATDQIIEALRQVQAGRIYLSRSMTDRLLRQSVGDDSKQLTRDPLKTLSDREIEVLRLIGQGHRTTEIAGLLHLSAKTIETYRDRIRQKLDLSDGIALVRYATQWVLQNG